MFRASNRFFNDSNLPAAPLQEMPMNDLQFYSPPLPHYIACAYTITAPGRRHASRRNIGVFDMLAVTKGCLFMGEDDASFEVRAGRMLILRPDRFHYAAKACDEQTEYYWVHFQSDGRWEAAEHPAPRTHADTDVCTIAAKNFFAAQTFPIHIPQFMELPQPASFFETLKRLAELELRGHDREALWEQQLLFQEALRQLSDGRERSAPTPAAVCAQLAASYLREHYRETVTAQELGDSLNFHPVYIARCMQKHFGCSPFEYLQRFRIEQAKLLLLRTDLPVNRVAEEVGFHNASYFSTCFLKYEGMTPRQYRGRLAGS
jgi:AraC-like DNA-binding protein